MSIEDYEAALSNGNYEAAARIVLSLPDRRKRTDTPDQFMLALTQLTAASEFLKPIPTAMITKIVQDMKPEQGRAYEKLSEIILANVMKLQKAK